MASLLGCLKMASLQAAASPRRRRPRVQAAASPRRRRPRVQAAASPRRRRPPPPPPSCIPLQAANCPRRRRWVRRLLPEQTGVREGRPLPRRVGVLGRRICARWCAGARTCVEVARRIRTLASVTFPFTSICRGQRATDSGIQLGPEWRRTGTLAWRKLRNILCGKSDLQYSGRFLRVLQRLCIPQRFRVRKDRVRYKPSTKEGTWRRFVCSFEVYRSEKHLFLFLLS
ncbi:hypothetical protein PVAP13_3KG422201 [Panicum virgatum]|uniref:Uncharacterized protein n=1 Tax=Panicum virgatum TaxID=38727 RepID=A0A8T0V756_PANVG|nr:hypothetical protein PVAP13_3KG422201 [Panicum virgatum]